MTGSPPDAPERASDGAPVVLVTGAARGIGAAVVRRLAARGCVVHALDACLGEEGGTPYAQASRSDLEALCDSSPGVTGVVADVRDPAVLDAAVDTILQRDGHLDHVVAAAAVIEGGEALWETDPRLLERLWATDVQGVWHTARSTVPHLLASTATSPSFVAISSAAGEHGLWHLSAYCVAKHAVVGLVRGLAADLKGSSVVACAVAPGSTDTAMLAATAAIYDVPTAQLTGSQHGERALAPDEVASVVEFAAFAGPVVHGSVLAADAGFSG